MATRGQLSWNDLVLIARRTGVENWVGKDYNGNTVRGKVVLAPSSHRGRRGAMGSVVGPTRHHTGTAETFRAAEDYPTYNVVKEGRSGLSNSLSAYGLGRWFGIYVFSEWLSYHAGTWSFAGITDGNGHFLGIEAEGTGARWTEFQREFYPRLVASILLYIGEDIDMMPRHADGAMPRGRKSDAANLPADFASKVAGYLRNPSTLTYGGSPTPTPGPTAPEEDEDFMFIRNEKGTITMVAPGVVVALDPKTWAGAVAAGHKHVQCSDAKYNEIVEQCRAVSRLDDYLGHVDAMLGDHVQRFKAYLDAQGVDDPTVDDTPAGG